MRTYLQLLIIGLMLSLSGQLFAHPGPVGHAPIANNTLHLLLHSGMTLLIGAGVFFISRWLISLLTSKSDNIKHY